MFVNKYLPYTAGKMAGNREQKARNAVSEA